MRFRIETGNNAGRMDNEITETTVVVTDNFRELFRNLKKSFINKWDLTAPEDVDCVNEFSEMCEEQGEFYIGMDEGHYISGWKLL